MNVWELYNFLQLRLNKNQSGNSFTIEDFNLAAKAVNIDYFKLKAGLPEEYQPGSPFPRQAWQVTQKITDDLDRFLVHMGGPDSPLLVVDQYGIATLPDDYIRVSALMYNNVSQDGCTVTDDFTPVEIINDGAWAARISSKIKAPSFKYPCCRFLSGKIEFAPKGPGYVYMSYLRMPVNPVLAYTLDDNNDPVYDAANSVQFEWPEDCETDLITRMLEWAAVKIDSPSVYQDAVKRVTTGQ